MENKTSLFLKSALNHGLIFGVILVIIQLVIWMVNFMPVGIGKGLISLAVNLLIYAIALIWFTKNYRNSVLGGFISYGDAFLYGLTVFMIATVVTAIYSFIFNSFIDPEYTSRVVKASADWTETYMRSKGVPEAQIAATLDKISGKKLPTPINAALKSLIFGVILGAIISSISAAFSKKVEDPFKEN
jgi:hypothetical protein